VPDPVNNYAVPMIDDYDYDALNRITLVTGRQQASSGSGWSSVYGQGYSYDRWGNRTINQAATYGTAINNTVYAVDTTTNRLTAMTYDAAGSVITDSSNAREYDAENHMKKAWGSGQWNYYVYDADGKRVRRIVGATETWMVYGIEGELVAEYPVNGAAATPQKEYGYRNGQMLIVGGCDVARWIVADHLGTPRMEVDPSGSLSTMRRHDYLPFGEELLVGMGNGSIRTAGMGYTSDCVRQRFGSYERDNETGLDFAQARYYANVQGRFTSPDPLGGHLTDPQTLSKYTYVRNNPLRFTDSTGLDFYLDCNGNSDTCKNGRVGTTTVDANGKKTFTATQISNDKNGNLVDQNGNQYTGNFDEKGFHFSNAQGDSFSGSFADKTAATTLSGAGIFDGFTGVFNSNGLNTNVAQGTLFGTQDQFNQLLGKLNGPNPGLDKLNFFHPGTDQYRGGNRDGVDPHLSYDPNRTPDPRNRVGGDDRIGQGLHYDGAYPYGSPKGFAEHTYSAVKFLFQTKVMGRKEIPPPQTIPR
jgi:RHS repeat-associated protein